MTTVQGIDCRFCKEPIVGRKRRYCDGDCRSKHCYQRQQPTCACGQLMAVKSTHCWNCRVAKERGHNWVERICAECGNTFKRRLRTKDVGLCCSRECGFKWQAKDRAANRKPKPIPKLYDCVKCRMPLTGYAKYCNGCSLELQRAKARMRYKKRPRHATRCIVCGKTIPSSAPSSRIYCTGSCSRNAQRKRNRLARRIAHRVRVRQMAGVNINPFEVFERDGWVCQLCRKPVARDKTAPHPKSPCVDHIVPLSKGGVHEMRNVQCAHFLCNSRKSDRGEAWQQRLF